MTGATQYQIVMRRAEDMPASLTVNGKQIKVDRDGRVWLDGAAYSLLAGGYTLVPVPEAVKATAPAAPEADDAPEQPAPEAPAPRKRGSR